MIYSKYPRPVVEDIARLRRKIAESGLPAKLVDKNLIIASWNIRAFGDVYPHWVDNPDLPKRNYRAMASIAEIVCNIDVIAIQEVKTRPERFIPPVRLAGSGLGIRHLRYYRGR